MKTVFKARFKGIGPDGEPVFETFSGARVHLPVDEPGGMEALDFVVGADFVITAEALPLDTWRKAR